MSKTVNTRICEVTVYNDQALVTRQGVVQLTGEECELVIAQLPATLVSESIRATGSGTVAVRLLEVRTERTYAAEATNQELARLTQEIGQLEEQKRQVQDQVALFNLQRNFIKGLNNQYLERLTRFQSAEQIDLSQIRELMDFVGQQYTELSSAIAQREKESQHLSNQLQTLRQQLQQLSTLHAQESFNVIVTVEPSAPGEFELELSYFVPHVSWMPLYDLRLDSTSGKVKLSYLAEVKQNTGENWLGVTLTLSTAKLGLDPLPLKPFPWYIDIQRPNAPGGKAKTLSESDSLQLRTRPPALPFPGMTLAPESLTEADKEFAQAQLAMAEISKQAGVVTFKVNGGSTILSDGVAHKTTIFHEDYPCSAKYIAIPRLVNLAYLQATIVNPVSGVALLPGQANVFRDNTFVGTTHLEHIAPGQEFQLNLGLDKGLKIDRVLVERQVDKKLVANQRRTTYAYRLIVTNLREQETELILIEQLPVSCYEPIKVRLTSANPEIQANEFGMLEWSLTLPPLGKQELYYQFTVEHPSELTLVGLDI